MNHEITVRRAEKEDVMQIAEILVEDWQTAYRGIMDDEFLDSMSAEQRYEIEVRRYQKFLVAADGDEILGYAWLEASDEEPADCEVIALYVRYAKRNRGIGKLLMQHAVNQFRENRNIPIGRYGGFSQKPKGKNSGRISNESLEQTATGKMERFWT